MRSFKIAALTRSATRQALSIAGLAASVVVSGALTETYAADMTKIRLGMTPKSFVESAQVIAEQQGIFKKNGLEVELVELRGDVLILRSLISGEVDIASVGSFAVFNAMQKGADIRAIVTPVPEQPHMLVAVKSIKGWKDLPGHSFAISQPGAISQTFPRAIMSRLGVDPDKVNYVAIGGNSARQKALLGGTVDATLLHKERALQVVKNSDRFHIIGSTAEYLKGVPLVLHVARTDWLKENRDAAIRYTTSIIEAVRFAYDNKPAMIELGKQLIGKDPEAVEAAYDAYRSSGVWGLNGGLNKKGFETTIQLGLDTGELEKGIAYESVVDMSYVKAALNELGRR